MSVSANKMHFTHPRLDFHQRQKEFNIYPFINYLTKILIPVNTNDFSYGESCLQDFPRHSASGLLIVV